MTGSSLPKYRDPSPDDVVYMLSFVIGWERCSEYTLQELLNQQKSAREFLTYLGWFGPGDKPPLRVVE